MYRAGGLIMRVGYLLPLSGGAVWQTSGVTCDGDTLTGSGGGKTAGSGGLSTGDRAGGSAGTGDESAPMSWAASSLRVSIWSVWRLQC